MPKFVVHRNSANKCLFACLFLKPLCFGIICQMSYWKDWRDYFNWNHIATLVWLSWGYHKTIDIQLKGRRKREGERWGAWEMSCLQQRRECLANSRTVSWIVLCQGWLTRFKSSFWSSRGSRKTKTQIHPKPSWADRKSAAIIYNGLHSDGVFLTGGLVLAVPE